MDKKNKVIGFILVIAALTTSAFGGFYVSRSNASHQTEVEDLTTLSAEDVSAYRWNAMAEYYAAHSELQNASAVDLTTLSAEDISAYRWNAMAEYYAAHSELQNASAVDLTTLSAEDISAYRWNAMAEFYVNQAILAKSLPAD